MTSAASAKRPHAHSGNSEYGSLEGELDALNFHRRPWTLTIWERITGLPVRCSFPPEAEHRVRALLRKRVRVSGLVNYFSNGRPKSISDFTDIEDLSPDPSRPRAGFGSLPGLTGDLSTTEYLRLLRAE